MNTRLLVNWLLALVLALGPVQSALAEAFSAAPEHHHSALTQDIAVPGDAAHADVNADQDSGHDHDKGHNHATCGAQCMAAMISTYTLTNEMVTVAYVTLSPSVTAVVLPTEVKPPRTLPI
ncbi:MAG: hypothetical protein ABIN45_00675 [Gammaproteobacteria bacterium]